MTRTLFRRPIRHHARVIGPKRTSTHFDGGQAGPLADCPRVLRAHPTRPTSAKEDRTGGHRSLPGARKAGHAEARNRLGRRDVHSLNLSPFFVSNEANSLSLQLALNVLDGYCRGADTFLDRDGRGHACPLSSDRAAHHVANRGMRNLIAGDQRPATRRLSTPDATRAP